MDSGGPVAATVDRVLAQQDQRRQLNSADRVVRRLGFAWALGGTKHAHNDPGSRAIAPAQSSSGLPGSLHGHHQSAVVLHFYPVDLQHAARRDDNGLKPTAGPLGAPCTAPFQFAATVVPRYMQMASVRHAALGI